MYVCIVKYNEKQPIWRILEIYDINNNILIVKWYAFGIRYHQSAGLKKHVNEGYVVLLVASIRNEALNFA